MHSFQEVSVDYMDMNPFKKIGKDWMLVTAGDEGFMGSRRRDVGKGFCLCVYKTEQIHKRVY